jgi:hypothetical protein
MRLSVAQALSEIELANAMAITDFFIIFLPIIELRTWLRERFSPATVHLSQSQQRRWTLIVPDSRQPCSAVARAAARNLPGLSFSR